jgi:hypothetical protein
MPSSIKPAQATKRYLRAMMGSALGYIAAVFGVSFIHDKFIDGSPLAIVIALIPGLFIALMVLALWRYLNEADEVIRHDLTQAMMGALFIMLMLSGGWGLAELFNDDMPRLPIFFVFPAFFLLYGLISAFKYKRCV